MRAVGRWSVKHRTVVIVGWLVLAIVAFMLSSSSGSNYAAGTKLSGTPSAKAAELLQRSSAGAAGDKERIAFAVRSGSVTGPAMEAEIQQTLANVARLPHVSEVVSPFSSAGAGQISANRRIAYASVAFNKDSHDISTPESERFVSVARAQNSAHLQVDVLGDVAANAAPSSSSSTYYGVLAALVVLFIVFGSLLAAFLPLVSTGIALFTAISFIGVLSNSLSMASFTQQLAILIGLGVGIDYSLFVLTRARTGIRRGLSTEDAVTVAAATAGRTVLIAGITVCIALLGMLVMGVSVLSGAAIAASVAVLFPMAAAQTLLPALIGVFGERTLRRSHRRALARGETDISEESPRWAAWAGRVERRRLGLGLAALAVLVALAVPAASMRQGSADYATDPTTTNTTTYRAFELLSKGFGPGFSGPLEIVSQTPTAASKAAFAAVVLAIAHAKGVVIAVGPTYISGGANTPVLAVAQAYPTESPQAQSTSELITRLRGTVIPGALHGSPQQVLVGGTTAESDDFASQLSEKLPLFVAMVVLLSFLFLMVIFRSVAIPATAAIMNLLSSGAAFGVIVAVFQKGWLASLVGVTHTGPISPLAPILMFAVLFGLSMDYEVFLVSRIHEEWVKRGNNADAVRHGLAITGRTINAAAAIMIVVFAAFALSTDRTIKLIGLGMAVAIAVDALLVRSILVPAVMQTLGKRNWTLPAVLERRLPHVTVEPDGDEPAPPPLPARGAAVPAS